MDWDDLRFFLAVIRQKSLSGAAKDLGVWHIALVLPQSLATVLAWLDGRGAGGVA